MKFDARDCAVSGASLRALEHFERALMEFQLARSDPRAQVLAAIGAAPEFAMARVFEGYLHVIGRDPSGAAKAADLLRELAHGRLNSRESAHAAALAAAAGGELDDASRLLGALLRDHPRDVLALQVTQSIDYLRGDARAMRDRVEAALPAWSAGIPGYHALLSMFAFGLEECGEYQRAEEAALRALELEPGNLRAHHAVTHVLEMQGRAQEGVAWMAARERFWAGAGPMGQHHWWHLALFHLELEDARRPLEIYDRRIAAGSGAISELIDSSALLWRLRLLGIDVGRRWRELAERWAPHAQDAYCAFNDLHAMMAFAGAAHWGLAHELLAAQARRAVLRGSNAAMTRLVGLPACRALYAFARGGYRAAEIALRDLPPVAHRIGGSQAQRNVLELTREAAVRLQRSRPGSLRAA